MRSEFEKLPDIAKNIDKYIYCESENEYDVLDARYAVGRIRINGAWYAYQHQQSKIDELQKRVDAALKMISINRGFAWMPESISQLEQALKGGSDESN